MSLEIEYDLPPLQKQQDEATEKGLKLLHKTKNRCYGYYELPCGHFSFLHYGSVRKSSSFKCDICQEQRTKDRVIGTGLEFVSKFEGSLEIPKHRWCDYGYYKHTACGHIGLFIHKNAINKKTNYCKECTEISYRKLAVESGLMVESFSRPTEGGTLYIDVTLPCGHSKTIQTGNFKDGNWKCQECWYSELLDTASSQGLEILHKLHGAYYRCKLPCGCEQDIFLSNIKSGSWNCHKCNDSYYNKSSSIYLIKFSTNDFEWLKLGFSRNVENRINNFKISGNYEYTIITTLDIISGEKAVQIEKQIHREFRSHRLNPDEMKRYYTCSGFTECYPTSVLNKLIKRLEETKINE